MAIASSFFTALQTGRLPVYVANADPVKRIDPAVLIEDTLSQPGDPFPVYVVADKDGVALSTAEDIFMLESRSGFHASGADLGEKGIEGLTQDDYNLVRLRARTPGRFGLEIHSDDGKTISAISVRLISKGPIKTLGEADEIVIFAYNAFRGDDGQITHATIYPAALLIRAKQFVSHVADGKSSLGDNNQLLSELVQLNFKAMPSLPSAPPTTSSPPHPAVVPARQFLPGLPGGKSLAPPTAAFKAEAAHLRSSAVKEAPDLSGILGKIGEPINMDINLMTNDILGRFSVAAAILLALTLQPDIVDRTVVQGTGKVKGKNKKTLPPINIIIRIARDSFRRLIERRHRNIEAAFKDDRKEGYSVPGLALVKRHLRTYEDGSQSWIMPHARCAHERVRRLATALLNRTPIDFKRLARLVDRWGTLRTRARLAERPHISRIRLEDPPHRGKVRNPAPSSSEPQR